MATAAANRIGVSGCPLSGRNYFALIEGYEFHGPA